MTLLGFLLLMAGLWAAGIAFAIVAGGDPIPPPSLAPRSVPALEDADVICLGVDTFTAATLLDMVCRDHPRERRVRLVYLGRRYEVRRPLWGRVTVRAISG